MLQNYVQYNPEKIIFGKGTECQVGQEVARYSKTCLLHYDGGDYINPLLDRIRQSLKDAGVTFYELGGVEPNPRLTLVRKGIEMVKEHNIGFVLAVGGGSTMDSAKFISVGTYYDGDIWNHGRFAPIHTPIIPKGVVLTLPGTGSEVSTSAVIRNDEVDPEIKNCFFAEEFRFDFAIINPELTYTLPPSQTAAGAYDIISHSMEDYFTSTEDAEYLWGVCETVINSVMKNVQIALKDPTNYTARANICRVAYVPLEDIMDRGTQYNFCVHNIEKPVTGTYHSTHGKILAIMMPAWMKYCYKTNIPLFMRLCVNCFGAKPDYDHPEKTIMEGIRNLEHFTHDIGLPTRLSEIGIDDSKFEYLADLAVWGDRENGYVGQVTKMKFEDIIEIYKLAL